MLKTHIIKIKNKRGDITDFISVRSFTDLTEINWNAMKNCVPTD